MTVPLDDVNDIRARGSRRRRSRNSPEKCPGSPIGMKFPDYLWLKSPDANNADDAFGKTGI